MRSISRFQEFLNKLPRGAFDKAVERYDADRYCKSFKSWSHLVAMVYAQVSKSDSLRDIAIGFNTQSNHHFHLGAAQVTRSTLADLPNRVLLLDRLRLAVAAARRNQGEGKEKFFHPPILRPVFGNVNQQYL